MIVREVMTPMPHVALVRDSIRTVLSKLAEADVRHLPVLEGGALVGIVSDRDLREVVPSVLEAIERILLAVAGSGPMLLVFEDLHWADASTTDLLAHVVTNVWDVPLLVLFTARPEFDESWGRGTRLQILELGKLARAQSRENLTWVASFS